MIKISTYDTFIKLIFQIIIQLIKTYNVITKKYMQDKIYEHWKFYYQLDNQTIFTTEKRSNIRILYYKNLTFSILLFLKVLFSIKLCEYVYHNGLHIF